MNIELKEYRKRLSLNTTAAGYSPPPSATQSQSYANGNDFQFNFPKFGDLPGSFLSNGSITKTTSPTQIGQRSAAASSATPPGIIRKQSSGTSNERSPSSFNGISSTTTGLTGPKQGSSNGLHNNYDDLNGLFDPSVLENASRNNSRDYLSYATSKAVSAPNTAKTGSMSSVNGHTQKPTLQHNSSTSITGSPTSSASHGALDSSCGTTPESSADSPDNRKSSEGGLDTINVAGKTQNKGK